MILAVFLDRVTASLGNPADYPRSLRAKLGRGRAGRGSGRTVVTESPDASAEAEREVASPRRAPVGGGGAL